MSSPSLELKLGVGVDHTEQTAVRVSQNHEVRVVGILPIDSNGAQRHQSLDLCQLLVLAESPEIEVGPIRRVQVHSWRLALSWRQEVWVGARLIAQRLAPEIGGSAGVRHVQ